MGLISWRFYLFILIIAFTCKLYFYFHGHDHDHDHDHVHVHPDKESADMESKRHDHDQHHVSDHQQTSPNVQSDSYARSFLSSLYSTTWWTKNDSTLDPTPLAENKQKENQSHNTSSFLWQLVTNQFLFLKRGSLYWTLFYLLIVFLVIHYLLNPLSCLMLELLKSLVSKILTFALIKIFPNGPPTWLQLPLSIQSVARLRAALEGFKWQDQIVVITGGASGLGNRLAKACIELGATVIVLDIKSVDSVALEASSPGRLFSYPCQIGDRQQVYEVAQFILQEASVIDMLPC